MGRRIPKSFINELIARADLIDVIGTRVSLKRAGSNHKGLCPFHDEKTPSFTVRPDKGFFKCFGCGAFGNVIDFVMRYENRTFPEAVEILADMLRIEIPHESADQERGEFDELYALLQEAEQIFRRFLRENDDAVDYLKTRGIDGPTAARFALGYAPDAWDTVRNALGQSPAQAQKLVEAGLAIKHDSGRVYDRFRARIMFPIRDGRGRTIGFGGRLLGPGEPKYMNSPETPLFDKSRVLYGLYEARQQPGRPDQVIVVEGYLDVVALTQHGIGRALATMGTATTADHVQQLTRLSDRVVFCFDGDRAGRAAAWRALETALPYGGGRVELRFLLLPEGEDPDSLVRREGTDAFRSRIDSALVLSTFMLEELRARIDIGSADGRTRLITDSAKLLGKLPQGVYRELLLGELAALGGTNVDRFREALNRTEPGGGLAAAGSRTRSSPTRIGKVIKLIAHYPGAAAGLGDIEGLADVAQPGADLLRRLLEMTAQNPKIMPAQLVEAFSSDPHGARLKELAAESVLDTEEEAPMALRAGIEQIIAEDRHRTSAGAAARALRDRTQRAPPE